MNALTNRPRIIINRLVHELPNLHEEIIEEILIRLPVKSLGRFRCVSRSWNSLIASRRFIKAHIEKSSANASFTNHKVITILRTIQERSLLSLLHGPSVRPVEYSFPTRDPYDIVGSCDGLLCLLVNEIDFIIWNPSTKKFTRLPSIVDGDLELVTSGFGYDESTDDYKVFGLLRGDKSKDIAKVYSLKTDSWRIVDIAIEIDPLLFISYYGNYFSGKLHWSRCVANVPKEQWEITTFDLENENFGLVELPNNTDYGSYQPSFVGALDGSLCMVCDHGTTQFDVWIKKHHESWYKMAVVSHPYALLMEPLFVGGNGEILFADGLSCSFVVYHPKDDRSLRPQLIDQKAFMGVHVYMESLVSAVPHVQLLINS